MSALEQRMKMAGAILEFEALLDSNGRSKVCPLPVKAAAVLTRLAASTPPHRIAQSRNQIAAPSSQFVS